MRAPDWNELLRLPEEFAAQRYLDGLNLSTVRWLAALTTVAAIIPAILLLSNGKMGAATAMIAILASNLAILVLRERPLFRRNVSLFLLAHAVLLTVAIAVAAPDPMVTWTLVTFVLATGLLLALRWRESLLWTLAAVLTTTAIGSTLDDQAPDRALPMLIVSLGWIGGTALVGRKMTRQRLAGFRDEFRRQSSVERERSRMRDELDDARTVQLSMLPHAAPDLPWIEVASVSVPATEVGGDYYDYLVLDDERVALVIGDVSGHGMASGLVLAALRGGLHLLRRELGRPVEVLERLDAMLEATTPGRMFVTLQLVLVDRRRRQVTVANAGHPPVVLLGGRGCEALGPPARPLGTRLGGGFDAETATFQPGDMLLLYTDGFTEVRNYRDEPFGRARLEQEAQRRRNATGVKALRDELLSSLTHFRGDVEQEDDITLIVVGLEAGGS